MAIAPLSLDRASFQFLCFPDEVTADRVVVDPFEMIDGVIPHDEYRDEMDIMGMSQTTSIVQVEPTSPFNLFGVSAIEVVEQIQTIPVLKLSEDDGSLFEDTISLIKGMSDLVDPLIFFDVLLGFVSPSDDVSIASFMDLSIFLVNACLL